MFIKVKNLLPECNLLRGILWVKVIYILEYIEWSHKLSLFHVYRLSWSWPQTLLGQCFCYCPVALGVLSLKHRDLHDVQVYTWLMIRTYASVSSELCSRKKPVVVLPSLPALLSEKFHYILSRKMSVYFVRELLRVVTHFDGSTKDFFHSRDVLRFLHCF